MSDTKTVADHLAEIEAMDYQQMLTTWMTGASYLVDGSEEKKAFDARFQRLRAEHQPLESASTAERNKKPNRKKGKRRV